MKRCITLLLAGWGPASPGDRGGDVGENLQSAATGADGDGQVVDEAGRADPARDGQQRLTAVPLRHVLERRRVDEDQVVDERERLADKDGARCPSDGRR